MKQEEMAKIDKKIKGNPKINCQCHPGIPS